ncbi:hypothetical protein FQN50_006462 [Emmonsiellopsis sp. PD_5]|nr:hypothetical protein FQN50_006462 [Emmonsiellopsis sp. PD_5]
MPNVWKVTYPDNDDCQFIIKYPQFDDSPETQWPAFQKEMEMQNLFRNAKFIRKMVDTVPSRSDSELPNMVLEPFEKTLWTSRTRRPLTLREIKHSMKWALLGLQEIHQQGLVYCDFKMENVLVNGFDDVNPATNDPKVPLMLQVKLGDLGSVMAPDRGEVTSISYRSPEVYLGKPWTSAVDIWAWGIAVKANTFNAFRYRFANLYRQYFHLLQAQVNFASIGIYDNIIKGTLEQKENAIRRAQCYDFNIRSVEYFKDCNIPTIEGDGAKGGLDSDEHWTDVLVDLGIPEHEILFLHTVLEPDPTKRLTATQILDLGYLDVY